MTKRDFWPLFRKVWEDTFTTKNIRGAWESTGIHPVDLDKVFTIIVQESPFNES